MITSNSDCVRALLVTSILFEKMGSSSISHQFGCMATFLEARGEGGKGDLPAPKEASSGVFAEKLRSVYPSVTISSTVRGRVATRRGSKARMDKHDWMDDVLRDVIAYAVLNKMPHVARHVALGLDALHLHLYEEERASTRLFLAFDRFGDEAHFPLSTPSAQEHGPISRS